MFLRGRESPIGLLDGLMWEPHYQGRFEHPVAPEEHQMPPKTTLEKATTSALNEAPAVGRTPWDLLAAYGRWALLIIPLAIAAMGLVHFAAEPGSEVNILGIKYHKARPSSSPSSPGAAVADGFEYPKNVDLWVNRPVVILDKNLSVRRFRSATTGRETLHLGGAGIAQVKAAARDHFARPRELVAGAGPEAQKPDAIVLDGPDLASHIEIEYKGRYYSIAVLPKDEQPKYTVSVAPLNSPTLNLRSFLD